MKKPLQYLLVGLPFSGKTTLVKELVNKLEFAHINLDEVKGEFGYKDISDDDVPDEVWKKIFEETDKRLVKYLKEGKNVVHETAYTTRAWRDKFCKVAKDAGFETKVVYLKIPESVARKRWLENKQTNKRYHTPDSVFEESVRDFEIPGENENVIIYDQNIPLKEWIKKMPPR